MLKTMISQIMGFVSDFGYGVDLVHLRRIFIAALIVAIRCASYFSVPDRANTWQKKKISPRLEKGFISSDSVTRTAKSPIGEEDSLSVTGQNLRASIMAVQSFTTGVGSSVLSEFPFEVFPRPPPAHF